MNDMVNLLGRGSFRLYVQIGIMIYYGYIICSIRKNKALNKLNFHTKT